MSERRSEPARVSRRIHPAWWVALATFLSVVCAAGVRSMPGVLIAPLNAEFGWSLGTISVALSINLVLFGLTAPFAAALMERFGCAGWSPGRCCWSPRAAG